MHRHTDAQWEEAQAAIGREQAKLDRLRADVKDVSLRTVVTEVRMRFVGGRRVTDLSFISDISRRTHR